MKTSYPNENKHIYDVCSAQSFKKIILFFLFIILAILSFAGGGKFRLDFKNSSIESGSPGANGTIYRFENVDDGIDALVKINDRSNALVYLVNMDMHTSGYGSAWQPQVGYNNGTAPGVADWWMEFRITFVQEGTTIPVTVSDFDLSAIDIDGNADKIKEYVSFYGLNSYLLEENSVLDIHNITGMVNGSNTVIGKKFVGPTANFTDIDTSGTSVMVTTNYLQTNVFTVRVGGMSSGVSGASERMYSLYFKDFSYSQPQQATLPVTLESFNATLSSAKAELNWTASAESAFSHYIVERSFDGREYNDITMVFANSASATNVSYSYAENISGVKQGLVYYRLKMVNIDGSFSYSAVRVLKLSGATVNATVTAYPNPVSGTLRITIPSDWQDKQVAYDLFNTSGQMVRHLLNNRASQTESFQLAGIQAGTYIIKIRSGNQSAVQQIVKLD